MKKIVLLFVVLFLSSCMSVENTRQTDSTDITVDNEILQNVEQSDKDAYKTIEALEESVDGNIYEEVKFPFEPSDSYGKLLPYVGEYSNIPATSMSYEKHFYKYGLCTGAGRIVVDAFDHVISRIRSFKTEDGFSFYAVDAGKVKDYSYDGYHPQKTYIIPLDGSWCIELEEGYWSFVAGEGGIFAMLSDEETINSITYEFCAKTLLFDYKGDKIKEFGKCRYLFGFDDYCDGYAYMAVADENYENDEYIYLNSKGETIEDPDKNKSAFNDYGVAIRQDEAGLYYLEDIEGHYLTEAHFDKLEHVSNSDGTNGVFVAKSYAGNDLYEYRFFLKDGRFTGSKTVIFSKHDIEIYFPKNGDIICQYLADDGVVDNAVVFMNLSEQKIIYEDHSGRFSYYKSNDNVIVADGRTYGGGFGMIFDYDGNELLSIDDFYSFNDVSKNGRFLIYTSCANYYDLLGEDYTVEKDERKTFIYDIQEGKVLHSFHGLSSADFIGNGDRFVRYFNYTAEVGGNVYNYGLYDTKNDELVVDNAEDIQHYSVDGNDYFAVSHKNSSVLYDSEMNEIITTCYE